jgi:hypothetical protein
MMLIKSACETIKLIQTSQLKNMINIPDVQRVATHERCNELYNKCIKSVRANKEITGLGCLSLGKFNDTYWLLDGQHRLLVCDRLYEEIGHDQMHVVIITECETDKELDQLFNIINDTCPVADIPKGVEKKESNIVVTYFYTRYPQIFKASKTGRVQRPHLHITRFEEEISKLLLYYKSDELVLALCGLNNRLKKMNANGFIVKSTDNVKKIQRFVSDGIRKGGLLFGIYANYECFAELYPKKIIHTVRHMKKHLKDAVWKTYNGSKTEGTCPFCNINITRSNCHFAHNVAHIDGGLLTVDNLYPTCSSCNLSMGTKTYEDMVKHIELLRI